MDPLDLLSHYRHTDPAEETVIAAAAMAVLDCPDLDVLAGHCPPRRTRPRRRRQALVGATGLVAAALAVTGLSTVGGQASPVTAVSTLGGHAPHGTTRPAVTTPTGVETVAYVVDHLQTAVDASTAVLYETQYAPDSQTGQPTHSATWISRDSNTTRTENFDPIGNPTTGYVVTVTPQQTTSVKIDYQSHTWSTTTYPFGSSTSSSVPAPAAVTPAQQAAQLQVDVAAGTATLVGPTTVDGQRAIEIQQGTTQTGFEYTWVDPTTYLTIREIDAAPGVSPTSNQAIQNDYQWLPATSTNLQLLTTAAAIPAGFTRVEA